MSLKATSRENVEALKNAKGRRHARTVLLAAVLGPTTVLALLTACSSSQGRVDVKASPLTTQSVASPAAQSRVTELIGNLRQPLRVIEASTDTQLGIALYDGQVNDHTGTLASLPSWSTVKVPIALAAQKHCDFSAEKISALIEASIEISDNDSTTALLSCVGQGDLELANRRVAAEVESTGSRIDVAPSFGRSEWPLASAARYSWYLSNRDEDNEVVVAMHNIADEQSWGLGTLDNVAFKGGWSNDYLDGSWNSRQMGFIRLDGAVLGVAIAARSPHGSYADTIEALDQLASALSQELELH